MNRIIIMFITVCTVGIYHCGYAFPFGSVHITDNAKSVRTAPAPQQSPPGPSHSFGSVLEDAEPVASAASVFAQQHPVVTAITVAAFFPKLTWSFVSGCFSSMYDFAVDHLSLTLAASAAALMFFEPTRNFITTQAENFLAS